MLELLALVTEGLALEPVKLLDEDYDLVRQLLIFLLKFLVHQIVDK